LGELIELSAEPTMRPNMMSDGPEPLPATRESWTNHPLPEKRSRLDLSREFTEQEYEALRRGSIPEAMEDKWFIFAEDAALYFHRSWTGHCIYQLTIEREGEKYWISEALVNRDPSQYSSESDDYDVKLLTFLIDNFLLGKNCTFPLPGGVRTGVAAGLYHHHVAGVGSRARGKRKRTSAPGWLWAWLKWLVKELVREWRKS
jgi:hypothetical protein